MAGMQCHAIDDHFAEVGAPMEKVSLRCRRQRPERPDVHVLVRIDKQSPDITASVHVGKNDLDVGADGQGINFGYAVVLEVSYAW